MAETPEDTVEVEIDERGHLPTANGYPKPPFLEVSLGEVIAERVSQEEKWGENTTLPVGVYNNSEGFNDSQLWLKALILQEEVGEVARAILDHQPMLELYKELAQVAAVAIAFMESILEDQTQMALDATIEQAEKEEEVSDSGEG